jgi:hypothetical protein
LSEWESSSDGSTDRPSNIDRKLVEPTIHIAHGARNHRDFGDQVIAKAGSSITPKAVDIGQATRRHQLQAKGPVMSDLEGDAVPHERALDPVADDDRPSTIVAIREGLAEAGRVKPARETLDALAKRYGIPVSQG